MPIFQMRRLRLREVTQRVRGGDRSAWHPNSHPLNRITHTLCRSLSQAPRSDLNSRRGLEAYTHTLNQNLILSWGRVTMGLVILLS